MIELRRRAGYSARIISLVPSLTELLFDLNLGGKIVGRTRFCIHPSPEVEQVPIVGGTKNPNIDKILKLRPDLVVVNREENRKTDVERIQEHLQVHITEIKTVDEAISAIFEIGRLCGRTDSANTLIADIQKEMDIENDVQAKRVAYLIWQKPWMTVGRDTYIHSVLEHWKFENVFADQNRYPEISLSEIRERKPDFIFLSSEPFPFKKKHVDKLQREFAQSTVIRVDGEWFSWYGSRMLNSFKKLKLFRKKLGKL